eukprot:3774288-Pleurochrysis_carterae.AAC.2
MRLSARAGASGGVQAWYRCAFGHARGRAHRRRLAALARAWEGARGRAGAFAKVRGHSVRVHCRARALGCVCAWCACWPPSPARRRVWGREERRARATRRGAGRGAGRRGGR